MPVNPATKPEHLSSPIARANDLNDPNYENQQGYFPYDLTHQEFITPRFGEIVPSLVLDTVPGDRTVVHDNVKTILTQIQGNLLSNVNQYVDSFYIPLRCCFPNNYEKLIPNPTKGDDLPQSALPVVPFSGFFRDVFFGEDSVDFGEISSSPYDAWIYLRNGIFAEQDSEYETPSMWMIARLLFFTTLISRGQLLDYMGICLDTKAVDTNVSSRLQDVIDRFHRVFYINRAAFIQKDSVGNLIMQSTPNLDLTNSVILYSNTNGVVSGTDYPVDTLSQYRSALADIFEDGRMPYFTFNGANITDNALEDLIACFDDLYYILDEVFPYQVSTDSNWLDTVDYDGVTSDTNGFELNAGNLNIAKILAYQLAVAQYFTNDSIDNIFNSELYMQLLRGTMFPSPDSRTTVEPVFDYNGVWTEYDLISYGGFWSALINNRDGKYQRQYVVSSLLFLLRRSLRYGDYFSTARPNLLAVGQLGVNIGADSKVSPIDITKNLLMQRYLNAVNYIGSGFLQYYASQFGVVPSDTGCIPRFISHRKISLISDVTTNTADNQGFQTTNLAGYADNNAFDVFIDDLGFLISTISYDVLPVYKSGIDSTYLFADRFDYFNPMLQNIGDQHIRTSEIIGNFRLMNNSFGYTMRNAEYKYKISRAHGAFVNSLPGFLLAYPLSAYTKDPLNPDVHISPDFIRDKPLYLDSIVPQMTGISPAEYYHFVLSCTNQVLCARKIQATPAVLF